MDNDEGPEIILQVAKQCIQNWVDTFLVAFKLHICFFGIHWCVIFWDHL